MPVALLVADNRGKKRSRASSTRELSPHPQEPPQVYQCFNPTCSLEFENCACVLRVFALFCLHPSLSLTTIITPALFTADPETCPRCKATFCDRNCRKQYLSAQRALSPPQSGCKCPAPIADAASTQHHL